MKTIYLAFILIYSGVLVQAQDKDTKEILALLANQTTAWNKGDLDTFMKTYWNNDSLIFVGKTAVSYGYQAALDRYKTTYNTPDKMGKLFFDVLKTNRISDDCFYVLGKWFLKRNAGDVAGHYTLIVRRIKGQWLIVSDHSS